MRLDPRIVQQQVENLKLLFPEIAEDEDAWSLTIESETDFTAVMEKIANVMREAAAMAGGISGRIAELETRQERFTRREAAMRALAFKIMQHANQSKCELPEVTMSIRRVPPSVVITDEAALPDIACKFVRKPDKTKIKELLATDPYIVAGASMNNGSETLSVRTK